MAHKTNKEYSLTKITFILVSAYLLLRFIASFFPETRLWGLNHAAFINGLPFIFLFLFVVALILYFLSGHLQSVSTGKSIQPHLFRDPYAYILPVIFGCCFIFFSVKAHFLGDGYTLLSNLSGANPVVKGRAYGEMQLQLLYHKLSGSGPGDNPVQTFQHLSIISGLIYIVSLLYYSRRLFTTGASVYGFILLNLLAGGTILYYGYVETYSVTSAVIFLFLLSTLTALKYRKFSIVPIVAFPLAVFLHWISIVYLPAFALLLLLIIVPGKGLKILEQKRKYLTIVIILAFGIFYFLAKMAAPPFWQRALLPPISDRFTIDGYTLFSIKHILDLLNLALMLAPVAAITIIMRGILKKKIGTSPFSPAGYFLVVAAISGLLAAFLIEPKLGMARDWDLMSVMILGVQIAGTYYWIELFQEKQRLPVATAFIIILSLAAFVPWLVLHNSRMGLYNFARATAQLDPKHGRTTIPTLKIIMERWHVRTEVERLNHYSENYLPEIAYGKEGERYYNNNEYQEAIAEFDRAIVENPSWFGPYMMKGVCYLETNRLDEGIDYLRTADALNPYNSNIHYYLGIAYQAKEGSSMMKKEWNLSLEYDRSNIKPIMGFGMYYLNANQPESTIEYLTLLPETAFPAENNYYLGLAYLKLSDTSSALDKFDRYRSQGKNESIFRRIDSIMVELRKPEARKTE